MNIKVNNKAMAVSEDASLSHLAKVLDLPEKGVAIAINNRMVPRVEWSEKQLAENDQVVVIKAACGG